MEIKAKRILTILSIVISSVFVFQNCNYFKSSNFVTVLNHKVIYDSINYKGNDFKVNLYTTLEFNESAIKREKHNDFLLVIKKDTFALVPEINYLEKESHSDRIQIKYFSQINFQSKIFNNDSILNVVKTSSKIIDSRGKEIYKNGAPLPHESFRVAQRELRIDLQSNRQKLEKIVTENGVVTTTNYLGSFQYKNTVLEFFPTAEGYIKNTNGIYSYVFQYKDHLGNIRLSYTKNAQNALEIIDENHYYPFGL